MKKITLFFLTLSFALFSWQSNAQLTEDFEAGMTNLTNATGNTVDFVIETTIIHGGAQSVKNVTTNSNTNVLAQTAVMDLSTVNNPILDFWHIAKTEGGWDKCYVEISTDGGLTYTALPAISYLGASANYTANAYFHEDSYGDWGTTDVPADNAWWKKESFNLSAYKVANVKIRFRSTSDTSASRDGWYIDDVVVMDSTSCIEPNAQTVANITIDSADLGWNDNAGATLWDVEVVMQGATASGTPTDTGVTNPFTKTGLTSNTAYDFYVRANCGGGPVSNWRGPFTFTTLQNLPDCPTLDLPADLAVDVISNAVFSWVAATTGGTATGYHFFLGDSAATMTDIGTLTGTTATITGLNLGQTYFWSISPENTGGITDCSATVYSFTVISEPAAPTGVTCTTGSGGVIFMEEMDAQGSWTGNIGTGNDLWNFGASTISTGTGPTAPHSGSAFMYFESSGVNTNTASAVSPAFDLTSMGAEEAELSFYLHAFGAGIGTFEVGVSTSATGPFTNLLTWTGPIQAAQTDPFIHVGLDVSAYLGGELYIEFKQTGANSFTGDVAIDLLEITSCVSCGAPLNLVADNIVSDSADISWTDGAGCTTNKTVTVTPAITGSPFTVACGTETLTLTGLTSTTDYTVEITNDCAGNPSASVSFTTTCPVYTPFYLEDFTTYVPTCWEEATSGDLTAGPSNFGSGNWNAEEFAHGSGTGLGAVNVNLYAANTSDWIISPEFDLSVGGYELLFDTALTGYNNTNAAVMGSDDEVQLVYTEDGTTWNNLMTWNTSNQPATAGETITIALASTGTNVKFAFWASDGTINDPEDYDFHFDNFKVRTVPTCLEPSDLVISGETAVGADIAWTDNNTPTVTNYEYVAQPLSTGVPTGAGTPTTSNPTTITGLNSSTQYEVYIRADCGTGDFSEWEKVNFTTLCGAFGDFTENFDTTAVNSLPLCWSSVVTSTSAAARVGVRNNLANSEPNSMELYNGDDTSANLLLITPQLTDLPNDTHRIRFMASGGTDYGLLVGTMTDPTDATTFAPMAGVLITAGFNQYTVNFTTSTTNQYVAMRHAAGTTFETIKIDDFVWEPIPTIAPVCAVNVVADNVDSVCGNFGMTVTWDAAANADGYKLTVGTTAGGTDVLNMEDVNNVLTYQVTTMHNTQYFYTLTPYNAAGDAVGCTEANFTTAADGCYCDSTPTSNDADGVSNVQLLTTDYASPGDVTYEDHTAGTVVDFPQGLTNNVQITFTTGYTYDTHIWVDLNDDLVFDDATELLYSGESLAPNPTTLDASFLMPATATLGNHRMRIGTADSGQATANSCYSGSYGVTLDFTINVIVATCVPAIATTTVVPDCANSQYSIDVDVTTVGDATEITDGTTTWAISGTGIINVGPFTGGSSVSLSITHTDVTCDFSMGTFTYVCSPANDDCVDADTLTVNTDATCTNVTAGTIAGATDSGVSDNGTGTPNDDVWYTFVATDAVHKVSMLNVAGTYTDLAHEVLSGDCTTLVSVNVSDPDTSTVTGLTVGDTYYVRVFGWSSTAGRDTTFDVCVTTLPPPPANDDCANAIVLVGENSIPDAASATQTAGTIEQATDSSVAAGSCNGTPNDDVWYSFVATEANYNITIFDDFDGVVDLFSGACGTLTHMACQDFGTNPEIAATGLTVGDTYYVRVYNYSGTASATPTFGIAVWRPENALSVSSNAIEGFSYYPNPVSNELTMTAKENITSVSIFNMMGQEVRNIKPSALETKVDMSNLSTGTYFVRAQVGEAVGTFKVIKK